MDVMMILPSAQALTQSHALAVVEVEAEVVGSVARGVATALTTRSQAMAPSVRHLSRHSLSLRKMVTGVRQWATRLRKPPVARRPVKYFAAVRSTADFRPDLEWGSGRFADCD